MDSLRPRRPSPALVVSTVALLLALGGSSYAAFKLGKNTVGTKQLKNGAVTTKKIKNGAVTGKKIKLSSLGTVPKANFATTAGTANNANALGGHPASDFITTGALNKYHLLMSPGDADVTVDTNGALSIVAHCDTTGPTASLFIRSTLAHSSTDANQQNNDFGPADTAVRWGSTQTGPGATYEANVDGLAVAPDGSQISLIAAATGYNIGSAPSKCIFAGSNLNG